MCLEKKDKRKSCIKGTGYKVIRYGHPIGHDKRKKRVFYTGSYSKTVELNNKKWNIDPYNIQLNDFHNKTYQTGFHIWKTVNGAETWKRLGIETDVKDELIQKVEFRKVTATGIQEKHKVIVAREFRFVK